MTLIRIYQKSQFSQSSLVQMHRNYVADVALELLGLNVIRYFLLRRSAAIEERASVHLHKACSGTESLIKARAE